MRVGIFPGSFDPFTKGHENIVRRSLALLDQIVIAMGVNTQKKRYFDSQSVQDAIVQTFSSEPCVRVVQYNELTARLAQKYQAKFLIRGLRNTTDFEFENSVAQLNKHLHGNLETIFLITAPELAPINSSLIREVHAYNGDVSTFLPYSVSLLTAVSPSNQA